MPTHPPVTERSFRCSQIFFRHRGSMARQIAERIDFAMVGAPRSRSLTERPSRGCALISRGSAPAPPRGHRVENRFCQ